MKYHTTFKGKKFSSANISHSMNERDRWIASEIRKGFLNPGDDVRITCIHEDGQVHEYDAELVVGIVRDCADDVENEKWRSR